MVRKRRRRWERFQFEEGSMQTVDAPCSVAAAVVALYVFVQAML